MRLGAQKRRIYEDEKMSFSEVKFADADKDFKSAKFIILGAQFDATSSFRAGSRLAPNAIREASWNFESYLLEHNIDISEIPVCDAGNLEEYGAPDDFVNAVEEATRKIIMSEKKFPILIGGEHSLTIGAANAFENISVIILDAHMDFRSEYLGIKNSHACVTRRVSEIIGTENIICLGIRSCSKEEIEDAKVQKLKYYTVSEIKKRGIAEIIKKSKLKDKIYLSIDMDVVDPAFAPGIGNPEPLGLTAQEVLDCIEEVAPNLVGCDIVEVCPPYDNGNTAVLAAKIIRGLVAMVWKNNIRHTGGE